jgi:hypothetical protein
VSVHEEAYVQAAAAVEQAGPAGVHHEKKPAGMSWDAERQLQHQQQLTWLNRAMLVARMAVISAGT